MGFFTLTSPKPPSPPKRTQRALCWEARDAFFACLDAHHVVNPNAQDKDTKKACAKAEKAFEKECVGSWVEYFKKRRVAEWNKERQLNRLRDEGAKGIEEGVKR